MLLVPDAFAWLVILGQATHDCKSGVLVTVISLKSKHTDNLYITVHVTFFPTVNVCLDDDNYLDSYYF